MVTLPLVTVILPVYNGEKFLAEAIQNIKEQNYQSLEIIVIDDGSTDKTAEVAAQFHDEIRYVYQSNQGPAAARNQGSKLAQGEVITFLDVDDLWADNMLLDFTDYLITHPDVEIVQGLIQQMQLDEKTTDEDAPVFKPVFQPYQFINLGSALYRKSAFDKVGLFDLTLRDSDDTDWFVRAWEQNITKVVIPKTVLFYRKHDRNITRKQDSGPFSLIKLYKRHIDRVQTQGIQNPSPVISLSNYCGQSPD
ncbi:glycosyltransferase [Merismopedia glauca]|nr:glycosyltransferase [Merismopedia glauca]